MWEGVLSGERGLGEEWTVHGLGMAALYLALEWHSGN
jgi:hypothetical protein